MSERNVMYVKKRNGKNEPVMFDKISERISTQIMKGEKDILDPIMVAQKVIKSIYSGITTEELDIETSKICANLNTKHPLYSNLAGRILISNLHKKTLDNFVDKINIIQEKANNILDKNYIKWINENKEEINKMIDYDRDMNLDFFGFKTLERAYLIKDQVNKVIIERPQDMFLRVASYLNMGNLENTKKTYDLMSKGMYTHASPTLYNSATKRPQLSSCFLLGTEDSIEGITKTWHDVSMISKWAGGIGLHVSNIRAKGTIIKGTNGPSSGIIPMLQVYNNIARYINQGGKRKGSFAIYLEPHHPDILAFLDLRKNFGAETERARDLFLALWISDLFMEQVQKDGDWYLMCPDECPGLNEVYGDDFKKLYNKYVKEKKYKEVVKARKIMKAIMDSQIETGTPYMLYKNSCNKRSNQKNLGTIKSSNLCAEILEYSDSNESAVCNLASIAINKFVESFDYSGEWKIYTKENCKYCRYAKNYLKNNKVEYNEITGVDIKKEFNKEDLIYPQIFHKNILVGGFHDLYKYCSKTYNYKKLYDVAYDATVNLNTVIDLNYYPTNETKKSNMKHRPIGLGIQGLANALADLRINFDSNESLEFNSKMMETIYFAAISASNDVAKERYELIQKMEMITNSFPEYYLSQFNPFVSSESNKIYHKLKLNKCELKNINETWSGAYSTFKGSPASNGILQFDMWDKSTSNYDWNNLKQKIIKYGIRNSLVTALMPTASTSQILGNNECFEYFNSNIYTRRTLAGDFPLINKQLVRDLIHLDEWDEDIKNLILANNGSIQNIKRVPNVIKDQFKTIWEIKQIWVLKNALARAPFVDQTQSMNIFMATPDYQKLNSCHFWAWKNNLKTGIYYLRSKPSKNAIKFTIDPKLINKNDESEDEICDMCSA